jgi:hypothetical protein
MIKFEQIFEFNKVHNLCKTIHGRINLTSQYEASQGSLLSVVIAKVFFKDFGNYLILVTIQEKSPVILIIQYNPCDKRDFQGCDFRTRKSKKTLKIY